MDPLGSNPWWTLLIAAVPALLCTILIFMDQQITAVIINRKEHKLKVKVIFTKLECCVSQVYFKLDSLCKFVKCCQQLLHRWIY